MFGLNLDLAGPLPGGLLAALGVSPRIQLGHVALGLQLLTLGSDRGRTGFDVRSDLAVAPVRLKTANPVDCDNRISALI
jgi:hypothetical protein